MGTGGVVEGLVHRMVHAVLLSLGILTILIGTLLLHGLLGTTDRNGSISDHPSHVLREIHKVCLFLGSSFFSFLRRLAIPFRLLLEQLILTILAFVNL